AVILSESQEIDDEDLAIDLSLIDVESLSNSFDEEDDKPQPFFDTDEEGLSLEDYFHRFILEHQEYMSETDLARKLGVSRKSLWERRQHLGIQRKKSASKSSVTELLPLCVTR